MTIRQIRTLQTHSSLRQTFLLTSCYETRDSWDLDVPLYIPTHSNGLELICLYDPLMDNTHHEEHGYSSKWDMPRYRLDYATLAVLNQIR